MSEFPPQLPHGDLTEVLPDVYFVTGQSQPEFNGKTFRFSRNMTVIRDGDVLTLVNTLRLDDAGLARLDALGTVGNIVKLGAFHGRDDAFYKDRYEADLWALPGMPHERGVATNRELDAGQSGPCADADPFVYETSATPEAVLRLGRHGGILLSCDSLQNWTGPDEYFDEASAAMMQAGGFFNPANVGPGWLGAAKPDKSDFLRLKDLEYRHLLSAHGAPLLDDAKSAIEATLKRLFDI